MSAANEFQSMILQFMQDDPTTVYYTKYTQGVYDPTTSLFTTTAVEIPCSAIFQDLTRNNNGLSQVYGKEILEGDKDMYLYPPERANPSATPLTIDTTSDRVRVGNILYKVAVVKSADPTGNAPLLYNMMLRR